MEVSPKSTSFDFIETIISSYEERIHKIEEVFHSSEVVADSSNNLFYDFEHSLLELRKERMQLNEALREDMAKNGSLRKNDYDSMMKEIFDLLDEKEKEAEQNFREYIEDQKNMVHFLRQGMLSVRNIEDPDYRRQVDEFKKELEHILVMQQQRKSLVISKFLEFQNVHIRVTEIFRMILKREKSAHFREVKEIKKHLMDAINL